MENATEPQKKQHLVNAQKMLDDAQERAIKIAKNAVVSAGAGSGKTRVLAERFTHLVLEKHIAVDEILTLTFTKKATVEMYGRIYKTLKNSGADISHFYKAHIQTLDSYCASVAKMGAQFYGISPDFTEDNDAVAAHVSAMALPFILKHRDNEAIQKLVKTKDFAKIANELFVGPILAHSTVAEPIDFTAMLGAQKQEVQNKWEKYATSAMHSVSTINELRNEYSGNAIKLIDRIGEALLSMQVEDMPEVTESDFNNSDSTALESFIAQLNKLANVKLAGGNNASKPITEEIKLLRETRDTLISLANFVYGFSTTKAVFALLEEFQLLVNSAKRAQANLTYADVASLAVCILRDYPEIRAIEKQKYKAIMIDEFQDNNSLQRDLLFMLAEKNERTECGIPAVHDICKDKLFFVGDEKQSIYRFRGADVSVFRNLSNDFADGNLALNTNYRSSASLIASFNAIFGGERFSPCIDALSDNNVATGATDDDNAATINGAFSAPSVFFTETYACSEKPRSFDAVYHHVEIPSQKSAAEISSKNNAFAPCVHVALYDTTQEAHDAMLTEERAEAAWVAKKIRALTTEGDAPYKPSDIAILFRTYSPQPVFERALLNEGIPYSTETLTGFFNDGPTNDLFAFLRLCVYPADTMAYAQVLRSPFVNFSVDETNSILAENEAAFALSKITNLCKESRERYENARQLYCMLCESAKTEPLTKTVNRLWYEAGYRYETLWNKNVRMYETLYDRIFELARRAEEHAMSLAEFADSVRTYGDEKEKLADMDIPLEQTEGVHLLTIHKSKGLEFPVVFVCVTDKKGKNEANAEAVYYSKRFGVSINTPPCPSVGTKSNYFYHLAKDEEAAMASAELRRLAYVAITRAEKAVYVTGTYESDEGACTFKDSARYAPGGEKNPATILQLLSPVLDYYARTQHEPAPFTFETIPPMAREMRHHKNERENTLHAKRAFIKEAKPLYESAHVVDVEQEAPLYALPSHLYHTDDESYTNNNFAVYDDAPYQEINKIVIDSIPKRNARHTNNTSYEHGAKNESAIDDVNAALAATNAAEPRFTFAHFGTIAHAYMEAAITNREAVISNRDIVGLDGSETKLKMIQKICQDMQRQFKLSEIGKAAAKSEWHKAEYAFRSRVGTKIIKGTIDLVFKNSDGTYTIVDYKTNQVKAPELYYAQLACYREAVAAMFSVHIEKINCVLYYLRFGEVIDVTDACAKIDVLEAVEKSI